VFSGIFLKASEIGESLWSYHEYPARSVGKQEEEFLIVALVKSWFFICQEFSKISESCPPATICSCAAAVSLNIYFFGHPEREPALFASSSLNSL
jgi:hypothetical protein